MVYLRGEHLFPAPIVAWKSSPLLRQAAPHGFPGLPANVREHTVAASGEEGPKHGDSPEMVADVGLDALLKGPAP
jgi:hypothetical protein